MFSILGTCLHPMHQHKFQNGGMIVLVTILIIVITSPWYCSASCNAKTVLRWRSDGRCGKEFPLVSGEPSQCNPNSERSCCSDYGFCGNSNSHCFCPDCYDFRNVIRKPSCYSAHIDETGYINSPKYPEPYPSNQECCYDIIRPNQQFCGVGLLLEDIDMGLEDEHDYCHQDWLTLPSCVPETRICGNKTERYYQYLFQPSASAIRLSFNSKNNLESRRGFKIKYELLTHCPGPFQTQDIPPSTILGTQETCYTKISRTKGQFNSPFYPDPYPIDLDCIYEFKRKSPAVCGIQMTSVKFIVEDPISTPFGGACKDFLHLPSCWFLCGKQEISWIVEFQPGAKSIKLHFHSDPSIQNKTTSGFYINFSQITECP